MRKFVAKYSAGLRVRAHPTLQSEQLGVIKPEGVISFVEEVMKISQLFKASATAGRLYHPDI